ncbi:MAG: hypothetical protein QOJ59_4090 [Thermomicrobiales bacterium]|jgi:hypothetical protein|nr:hypothetical protein [Thermomicrobiales bacterium]
MTDGDHGASRVAALVGGLRDRSFNARFSRDQLGDLVGRIQAAGVTLEPSEVYEATGT